MKKIQLTSDVGIGTFSMPADPVYVLESNYSFTEKYSCWQKVIYKASVAVLLFPDRVTLVPHTQVGAGIVSALKKIIGLQDDRNIPSGQSFTVRKYINVGDYVDQIIELLSNFDADENFGLYGFFSYELINMKLGVDFPDLPIGIFYFPEVMSIDHGPIIRYSMQNGCDELKFNDMLPFDQDVHFDLRKFTRGDAGAYENLYDLAQDYISSRKIKSLNPSFTISKETKDRPYEIFTKLSSKSMSPYNFYISCFGCEVIGSSPAMFLRIKENYVETSPICGTISRGKSEEEDHLKIERLIESEKDDHELAECVKCDVEAKKISCDQIVVINKKEIEKFENVFHTSAHVTGMLRPDKTIGNVIEDHLWPSTIVGSPVAAAARIIAENETRNWYGGAFGYISINKEVDFGTMIRCAAIYKGVATTRVGSTLTKYSKPELERDELCTKASLILGVL